MTWILLLLLLLLIVMSYRNHEPFDSRIFPFHSPFDTEFHHFKEPVVSVDNNNITKRLQYLISDIKTVEKADNADLKLVPELTTLSGEDYNFVATLHHPTLLMLARDSSGMLEFGDIQHYSCRVLIGIPYNNSPEHRIVSDILNYYPESVRNNVDIIPLHKWTTDDTKSMPGLELGYDYHIHAQLIRPGATNYTIQRLTQEQPTHLMTMVRINAGNYFVTNNEKAFYTKHHYYGKSLYDLHASTATYPQLSRIGNQQYSLYLPTINCRYVLLAKSSVPDSVINKIMKTLFQLYTTRKVKEMTMTDIASNVTKLSTHPAASKIYSHLGLSVQHDESIYENKMN